MRVAIFGAGSLGTVLGAFITKGGVPIDLVNRNLPHIEALKNHGARITGTVDFVQEVSALTPPKPVASWRDIVLGRDGMTLEKGNAFAVFLPQVAPEQGWDLETTLSYLSQKAGLPADAWREGAKFETFQAEVFHE